MSKKSETTFKEIREILKNVSEEQKETGKQIKALERSLAKTNGNFNNKWGDFMEKLVKGDLVNLLKKRGIKVVTTVQRLEIEGENKKRLAEFDIAAIDGDVTVILEVKTTLEVSDVHEFIKKLTTFKDRLKFGGKIIYGGLGYLDATIKAKKLSMENGLFLIESPGGEAAVSKIVNDEDFRPKPF